MQNEICDLTELENVDKDKLFHKISNDRRTEFNNLKYKIKRQERRFKNYIINAFGRETIIKKPDSLLKLEKQLISYFFGKDGCLTYLIPNLRNELIQEEQKKFGELDKKIEIGELTFLNHEEEKNISKEKRKKINFQKIKILKSNNFIKEDFYENNIKTPKINSKNSLINNLSSQSRNIKFMKIHNSNYPSENLSNNSFKINFNNNKIKRRYYSRDILNKTNSFSNFIKIIPKKSKNNTVNNSSNSLSNYPNLSQNNSNVIKNLKTSNNFFIRKRNHLSFLNFSSSENNNQIEQYTVKNPNYENYFKTSFQRKMKKSKKLLITYHNDKKELLNKLDDYSQKEIKLSKSLYNIINKNKIKKSNKLKIDIEEFFDHKLNEDKKITMKEMIDGTKSKKLNKDKFQKNSILIALKNLSHNNQITKLVKDNKIDEVIKGKDLELAEKIKLTRKLLKKNNIEFDKVRNKLKSQDEIIKSLGTRLTFDRLRLKEKLKK